MLGVQQQTHSAATHHPTTRSAASAAVAVAAGTLRTPPISKRRQSAVQSQQLSDTVSPTQDIQETHAEAGAASNPAWPEPSRGDHNADEGRENEESINPEGENSEQNKPESKDSGEDAQQASEVTVEQEKREGGDGKTGDVEDYTRHPSSPLSELSPAPDDDDTLNQDEGDDEPGGEGNTNATSGFNANGQSLPDGLSDPALSVPLSSDRHATGNTSQSNSQSGHTGSSAHLTHSAAPFGNDSNFINGLPPSSAPPGTTSSQLLPAASTSSPGKPTIENAGSSGHASTNSSKSDKYNKFSILLELNAELFKVCQAFVAAGYVPQETPEAQPFSKKLEANLTWMSAHVDGVKFATSLPDMDPPVLSPSAAHIAFPGGVFERINNLYTQLPVVFARDIARRRQSFASPVSGTPTRNSATPSLLPPSGIGVKRERPDSAGYQRNDSPSAPKRRDTGEGKSIAGPNTPVQPGSAGVSEMPPPSTPGFSTPPQSQIARPASTIGRVDLTTSNTQAPGLPDGMFSPNSNPGMGMGGNMQSLRNIGGLSPEAQARARQMQIRQMQAQAMMQQQQQLQQQHVQQQVNPNLQHGGAEGGNLSMGSPQRQTQGTPSPTHAQQMMQAQVAAARQMSPPGAAGGMRMGMNGMDSNQQSSNLPPPNMNATVNGMGTSTGPNMSLNPQMIAGMGPAAMAAYQILQNPQHTTTQYLNQQMPGFSQLPMMEQMRRFQIIQQQRQLQQNQRNQQMMANQMMASQMRPTNAAASGSGPSQMQQIGQSGQMGMAPQMQSSTSDSAMQFPGTPTSANMPGRPATSMGMAQQMGGITGMQGIPNMANLNPQQRQLYLMQMQMRNSGAGGSSLGTNANMNPSMMNPQLLAERQRLEQQRLLAQRHGSPLNPAANSGQFPPGLRSNPTASIGIARTGRSPSVTGMGDMAGAATPRIGGRMLPSADDYQRQALLQQARHAQMQQQQGFMQGQGQAQGWPNQQSQQLPLSAGAWPQQNQGFGMGTSPPNTGMQGVDFMSPSRQSSATPAPMGHHSPTAPSSDFDNMMNW